MALVSRNETSNFLSPPTNHKKSTNMGKFPFVNPNPNPNFSINHQFSRKQLINGNGNNNGHNGEDLITVSDDASSFNQQFNQRKISGSSSGPISLSHYVTYNVSRYSKLELRILKSRLMSELEKVRTLSTRIESRGTKRSSPFQQKEMPMPSSKRGRVGTQPPPQQPPASYVASPHLMKMCGQVLTKVMKQKQGYVFNAPVDVVGMNLHDYHQIIKRPMDLGTIKKNLATVGYYSTPEEFAADVRLTFNNALVYNPKGHEVHTLAERFLDKFEQSFRPVYQKFLMEKEQFLRSQHRSGEIRHDSGGFGGGNGGGGNSVIVVDDVQGSSWSKNPSPDPPPVSKPVVEIPSRKPDPRPEPRVVEPPPPPPLPPPPPQPQPPRVSEPVREPVLVPEPVKAPVVEEVVSTQVQEVVRSVGPGRGPSGKLPKPKAKDPNKREMSMEEKHKLGAGLQSLPEEKMSQVINIIRRRNGHLTQEGDEIELDIEAVDKETLWELDRLVTNYKKMVSKMRRQALMVPNNVGHSDDQNEVDMSEKMTETAKAVKKSGGDVGDEDVDIGDEMPVQNFPPVEIDKDDDRNQGGGGGGGGDSSSSSSSGSSSSGSSSSSDSDSRSSSGSDSDVDDAQSRDNESKNIPH